MLDQLIKLSISLNEMGLGDEASNIEELINNILLERVYVPQGGSHYEEPVSYLDKSSIDSDHGYSVLNKLSSILHNTSDDREMHELAEVIATSLDKNFLRILKKELDSYSE